MHTINSNSNSYRCQYISDKYMCISIVGQPGLYVYIYFTFFPMITSINENMSFILKNYIWQGYTENLYHLSEIWKWEILKASRLAFTLFEINDKNTREIMI